MSRKLHILVTNDDGPPSLESSPYVHPLISILRAEGHTVSVCLPDQQRSWIGKAQFKDKTVSPQSYAPSPDPYSGGEGSKTYINTSGKDDWILIEGTPATCTQLGLFHLFEGRGAIDVVLSGPNYGRNVTALFSLSSGTLGGAMEAATFGRKAVALSFAFWGRNHNPKIIEQACKHSVKIVEHLVQQWADGVDVYSVNIPVVDGVGDKRVVIAPILSNQWTSGSCFDEIEGGGEENPEKKEKEIREGGVDSGKDLKTVGKGRSFRWNPKFKDVEQSIRNSEGENDGKVIVNEETSITPLKANFMHVAGTPFGELKLSRRPASVLFHVILDQDAYLDPLITEVLSSCLPQHCFAYQTHPTDGTKAETALLRIQQYENIDFAHHLRNPSTSLANSYVIRKALVRKNHLWHTISSWWVKHPDDTTLKDHVPLTVDFELDYAEYLDEALAECWELHESFAKDEKEWWVLKPAMSDQGHGIRMFSSEDELKAIFEEWEDQSSDEDEVFEDGANTPIVVNGIDRVGAGTMTSQLRHFVAQRYVEQPLVFQEHHSRKFHVRTYVLAVGALKVYVYRDMLALFAPLPYSDLQEDEVDSKVHLTNTCLQAGVPIDGSVYRFRDLPESQAGLPEQWKSRVCHQIETATSTLFEAAAREQMIHFQAIPNSFEVFGVDWLIDATGNAWLLEVNAFPDFKQSGQDLRSLVGGFWKGVVRHAVVPFFGASCSYEEDDQMIKVLDVKLGCF